MKGKKRDHNAQEIVDALRQMGALVLDLGDVGGGCPDLLVCWRRRNFFIEVKNPKTKYGKRGLNHLQSRLQEEGWPIFIARTQDEVTQILLVEAMALPLSDRRAELS